MQHTARYGMTFSSGQVFDHVAKATYCAATYSSDGMLGGVAFPKNAYHLKYIKAIEPALRKLEIEVFWVSPDGQVEVAGNWSCW